MSSTPSGGEGVGRDKALESGRSTPYDHVRWVDDRRPVASTGVCLLRSKLWMRSRLWPM